MPYELVPKTEPKMRMPRMRPSRILRRSRQRFRSQRSRLTRRGTRGGGRSRRRRFQFPNRTIVHCRRPRRISLVMGNPGWGFGR